MSIRAKVDGITFEFDSDEDLRTFLRAVKSGSIQTQGDRAPLPHQRNDETERSLGERMKMFYKAVKVKRGQLSVLRTLLGAKAGMKDVQLIRAVDFHNRNELGGVIAGISKTAKPYGLTLDALVERNRLPASEGRAMLYRLTPMAREYLSAIMEPLP